MAEVALVESRDEGSRCEDIHACASHCKTCRKAKKRCKRLTGPKCFFRDHASTSTRDLADFERGREVGMWVDGVGRCAGAVRGC